MDLVSDRPKKQRQTVPTKSYADEQGRNGLRCLYSVEIVLDDGLDGRGVESPVSLARRAWLVRIP